MNTSASRPGVGGPQALQELLSLGADPAAEDLRGDTPFDKASMAGHDQIAKLLHRVQEGELT